MKPHKKKKSEHMEVKLELIRCNNNVVSYL